jgi:hypothetical protein
LSDTFRRIPKNRRELFLFCRFLISVAVICMKMKVIMKKFFAAFFCAVLFAPAAFADAGKTGSRFLLLGAGARAAGMGEAFTGLADDVSAAYWNPAGLICLSGAEMLSMHDSWFEGISRFYAAAGIKLGGKQALGIQVNTLSAGVLSRFDDNGVEQGTFNAGETACTVSYACAPGRRLSLGAGVKVVREAIESESGWGFGGDIGGRYRASPRLNIGITVQNFGNGIKLIRETTPLPLVARAGAGYLLMRDAQKEISLAGDIAWQPIDQAASTSLGGEVVLFHTLAFRAGAKLGGRVIPAFGVGCMINGIAVDWATELFGDLGNPNRLSVTVKFGKRNQ